MNNQLRQIRRSRGLTILELQRKSGVSNGHISDIETGKKIPGVEIAQRLAQALDTTMDALFPYGTMDEQSSALDDPASVSIA